MILNHVVYHVHFLHALLAVNNYPCLAVQRWVTGGKNVAPHPARVEAEVTYCTWKISPPKNENSFSHYLLTPMTMGSRVKHRRPQNISGASQQNVIMAPFILSCMLCEQNRLYGAVLCLFDWNKSPSNLVVKENAIAMYCGDAPEFFCGQLSIGLWVSRKWPNFYIWVNISFKGTASNCPIAGETTVAQILTGQNTDHSEVLYNKIHLHTAHHTLTWPIIWF